MKMRYVIYVEDKEGNLLNAAKLLKDRPNKFKTREEAMDYATNCGLAHFVVMRTFEKLNN